MRNGERMGTVPGWMSVAIGVVTVVAIFLYGTIEIADPFFEFWDFHFYRAMSEAVPGWMEGARRPFAFRLLGPTIVGLLPVDVDLGYALASGAAMLVFALLFPRYLARYGIGARVATVVTLVVVFNTMLFGFFVWNPYQLNDALTQLYLLGLFLAMREGRWGRFAAFLLLGALTREVAALMVPTALVYLWERNRLREEWRPWLIASLAGLSLYALVRATIPVLDGWVLVEAFRWNSRQFWISEVWFRLLVNAFTPVSLLPLVFWRDTLAFARHHRHMLLFTLLVFISTFFGSNLERLMAPSVPVVYLLIARIVQRRLDHPAPLALLLVAALATMPHHLIARYPLPDRTLTIALGFGAILVVAAGAWWFARGRGVRNPTVEDKAWG